MTQFAPMDGRENTLGQFLLSSRDYNPTQMAEEITKRCRKLYESTTGNRVVRFTYQNRTAVCMATNGNEDLLLRDVYKMSRAIAEELPNSAMGIWVHVNQSYPKLELVK